MIEPGKEKPVNKARIINLSIVSVAAVAFYLSGVPWWVCVLGGFALVPVSIDHHFSGGCSTLIVFAVIVLSLIVLPAYKKHKAFSEADLNNDMLLTLEEFKGSKELFKAKDENKDSRLSRDEYGKYVKE